ncbi:MAG: murein biosynthesis integral membrane protein MurJ [Anaerolineaceae bacterium]|nr:murein biosynthesis integral membrane protein MurJ [Anaerolineaceae bacterium]
MQSSPTNANRQIARAAGTVMLAFVISNLVGLARNMIVVRVFGTSQTLDSFYAANRIAETLFNLIAGGALGSAFIPTFTGFLTRDDQKGAWELAASIANLLVLVLTLVSALAAIFAPQIVRYGLFVLDPAHDPVQEALTIRLLRILLPSVIIFGISGLIMGILNARQIFLIPAIAPAMYSVGWIMGVLLLPTSMGIERLAWGAVLGAGLHLLVQLPTLLRLRGTYSLQLGINNPAVREVMRLMLPRMFGVAVVQLNFIVNTIIALSLPEGSASSIGQGFALMLMPQAAIAQSIAIAAMPTFSAQVARGKEEDMRASLAATLRGVLLLSIPAALGLILLRQPITALLYQSQVCGPDCTQMIAWALLWYSIGLVGHCLVEITSRAFYALHDTRTPVTVGVIAMSLNIVFSLAFSRLFQWIGLPPLGGLALANSLATALEMVALLVLMQRRLKGLHGKEVLQAALTAAAAGAIMGAVIWIWLGFGQGQPNWLVLGIAILSGGLVYAGSLIALRVREIRLGWIWLTARFGIIK